VGVCDNYQEEFPSNNGVTMPKQVDWRSLTRWFSRMVAGNRKVELGGVIFSLENKRSC
jgi:hypothetical protein